MRIPSHERDHIQDGWLALKQGGMSVIDIAREAGVSPRTVQVGIRAARQREGSRPTSSTSRVRSPALVLIAGSSCKALAVLTCDDVHHGPIPLGSACCCAVCHQSGKDHYRSLWRDPKNDPRPEPKPAPAAATAGLTRKERRAILFASRRKAS